MRAATVRLAGRRYADPAVTVTPTSTVDLVLEPRNAVDRNAVAVVIDGRRAGYLEGGIAGVVAPAMRSRRPVFAAPFGKHADEITLYLPSRGDRLGENLVEVPSSRGDRSYVVDPAAGLCTCPAGRYVACRHKAQAAERPLALAA